MKIREFLTEANWGQGLATCDDKECLITASTACYKGREWRVVNRRLRAAVSPLDPLDWNDAPERTFAEVKALVERLDI